jgi:hypothetical protein
MIERTSSDGIVTLRLHHGKVAALDIEMLDAMALAFTELASSDARAVILTGTGTSFSAGVDLFRVVDGGADLPRASSYARAIHPRSLRIPKPLVVCKWPRPPPAASHAVRRPPHIAGEARIGMPSLAACPYVGPRMSLRHPATNLQALIYTGHAVKPDEAASRHHRRSDRRPPARAEPSRASSPRSRRNHSRSQTPAPRPHDLAQTLRARNRRRHAELWSTRNPRAHPRIPRKTIKKI